VAIDFLTAFFGELVSLGSTKLDLKVFVFLGVCSLLDWMSFLAFIPAEATLGLVFFFSDCLS
jgi:hypothetical protein